MPLPSFTITGTLFDLLGNVAAGEIVGNGLGGATPSKVTFTSNVPQGYFVTFGAAAFRVDEVEGIVNSDGTITRNGDPVQLLANDAGLSIDGLQWQCHVAGMHRFWFNAPVDAGTVNLGTVAPVPGIGVGGVAFSAGELITLLADSASPIRVALDALYGPGAVDEYHPYANLAAFPATGVTDRLYLALDTGKLYRWTGSAYLQIADKAAVGLGNVDNTSDANKPVSTAQQAALDLKATSFNILTKTANYTLGATEFIKADASGGALVFTLPTAPADKTRAGVKKVDGTPALPGPSVTINTGGSDKFNTSSGPTSATIAYTNQAIVWQYKASDSTWVVTSTDFPKSVGDVLYAALSPFNSTPAPPDIGSDQMWTGGPITETVRSGATTSSLTSPVTFTPPAAPSMTTVGGASLTTRAHTGYTGYYYNWKYPPGGGSPTIYPWPAGWFVQFDVVGTYNVEFLFTSYTNGALFPAAWQLMVDGKWVSDIPSADGTLTNGLRHAIKYTLPDNGRHTIRWYMSSLDLVSVFADAGSSMWSRPLKGPRAFFLGDSITAGGYGDLTGGELSTWIWRFSKLLGIGDVLDGGWGGTGPAYNGGSSGANYQTRATSDVVPANPDLVFMSGWINDKTLSFTPAQIAAACATTFDTILAGTRAQIIMAGSYDPAGGNGSAFTNIDDAIKPECVKRNIPYIQWTTGTVYDGSGNVIIDGTSVAGPWITTANKAAMISADGLHPTNLGNKMLMYRMYTAVRALLPLPYSDAPRIVTTDVTSSVTLGSAIRTNYTAILKSGAAPTMPSCLGNYGRYTLTNDHTAAISVATSYSQTIDGASTLSIPAGASRDLISTKTQWRIV